MHVQADGWKNTHPGYLSLLSSASLRFSVTQTPTTAQITELQDWLASAVTSEALLDQPLWVIPS